MVIIIIFASAEPKGLSLWLQNVYMGANARGFHMKLHNFPLMGLQLWGLMKRPYAFMRLFHRTQ
jgi:hypothetical protein